MVTEVLHKFDEGFCVFYAEVPEKAVMYAHAQFGWRDWNVEQYDKKYGQKVFQDGPQVVCGNFYALTYRPTAAEVNLE